MMKRLCSGGWPDCLPIRYAGNHLGDMSIEDAYVYPMPVAAP
jgi:hypothetical protein